MNLYLNLYLRSYVIILLGALAIVFLFLPVDNIPILNQVLVNEHDSLMVLFSANMSLLALLTPLVIIVTLFLVVRS